MKVFNIIKGWFIFLFGKRTKQASDRILICLDCKFRKGYFCGVCGCEIHAKASLKDEHCPKYRWPGDYIHKDPITNTPYIPSTDYNSNSTKSIG